MTSGRSRSSPCAIETMPGIRLQTVDEHDSRFATSSLRARRRVVTITLIAAQRARLPVRALARPRGRRVHAVLSGLVPAAFSWVTVFTSMFLPRRTPARRGQHALPLDLRRQRRRPHGARALPGVLPAVRDRGGARADASRRPIRWSRWSAPAARSPASWAPTSCSTRSRAS